MKNFPNFRSFGDDSMTSGDADATLSKIRELQVDFGVDMREFSSSDESNKSMVVDIGKSPNFGTLRADSLWFSVEFPLIARLLKNRRFVCDALRVN